MAQTRKKRRRKHSGTQAGTIQREGRAARTASKDERREAARRRRAERLDRPPTLRGSAGRAAIAALIFTAVVILAFGRPAGEGLTLGIFMFVLYIPIGYFTDLFIHRRRQRKKQEASEGPPRARKAGSER